MSNHVSMHVEGVALGLNNGQHLVPVQITFGKARIDIRIDAVPGELLEVAITLVGDKVRMIERNYIGGRSMTPKVTILHEFKGEGGE